jgi:hypothetical protein
MAAIAAEFLACFDALYAPEAFLDRALRSCLQQGNRTEEKPPRCGSARLRDGSLRGLLILFWRQGVRRPSRGRFWRQLAQLLWQRPRALSEYLWLLLIEEHMLRYRQLVHGQVRAQLASPLLQALPAPAPPAAAGDDAAIRPPLAAASP